LAISLQLAACFVFVVYFANSYPNDRGQVLSSMQYSSSGVLKYLKTDTGIDAGFCPEDPAHRIQRQKRN
jgi:hypothetical protein